jgi:hypothetical protein
VLHDVFGGAGSGFDIDLLVGNVVPGEEAFGFPAIGAPEGGIDDEFRDCV